MGLYQNYLWISTGGARGTPIAGYLNFYAYRAILQLGSGDGNFTGVPGARIIGGGSRGHATAPATMVGGVVTGITITNGGGRDYPYTATPTVAIMGGVGSGATATATRTGSAISGITVTAGGSGYTTTGFNPNRIIRVLNTQFRSGRYGFHLSNALDLEQEIRLADGVGLSRWYP